jgi:hypothetical protein
LSRQRRISILNGSRTSRGGPLPVGLGAEHRRDRVGGIAAVERGRLPVSISKSTAL